MTNSASSAPAPERPLRVLALTSSEGPIPRAFAHLVAALRAKGARVTPLPEPRAAAGRAGAGEGSPVPGVADIKAGLQQLLTDAAGALASLGRAPASTPPGEPVRLARGLRDAVGDDPVDAVVAVDAGVAARAFPVVAAAWPDAVRAGVAPGYHLDAAWDRAPLDDLVVAHPALFAQLATLREARARTRTGGPLVGGDGVEARRLGDQRPLVVASFAHMGPGDVDPFLLQLSLAHPEGFDLLFLPAGRAGVDELVRTRAGGYGLRGKRPRAGADPEPWLRGAAVLTGRPSSGECAAAVAAGVPLLIYAPSALDAGERFLVDQGAAAHAEVPLTVAVQLEALLPGGEERAAAVEAARGLSGGAAAGAAAGVMEAARAGRPGPGELEQGTADSADDDGELEDIGGAPAAPTTPLSMPASLRAAYLREIILQQAAVDKQLARAKAGHDTWSRRVRLAHGAGDGALARGAAERVNGLSRIISRLHNQRAELVGLRDRFAGRGPLTEADRAAAARFMSPSVAATLDGARPTDESAFHELELDDRLAALKRKLES